MTRGRLSEVLAARATEVCFVVVRAAVKPPFLKEARFLLRICAQLPPKNIRRSTIKAKVLRFNRNKTEISTLHAMRFAMTVLNIDQLFVVFLKFFDDFLFHARNSHLRDI